MKLDTTILALLAAGSPAAASNPWDGTAMCDAGKFEAYMAKLYGAHILLSDLTAISNASLGLVWNELAEILSAFKLLDEYSSSLDCLTPAQSDYVYAEMISLIDLWGHRADKFNIAGLITLLQGAHFAVDDVFIDATSHFNRAIQTTINAVDEGYKLSKSSNLLNSTVHHNHYHHHCPKLLDISIECTNTALLSLDITQFYTACPLTLPKCGDLRAPSVTGTVPPPPPSATSVGVGSTSDSSSATISVFTMTQSSLASNSTATGTPSSFSADVSSSQNSVTPAFISSRVSSKPTDNTVMPSSSIISTGTTYGNLTGVSSPASVVESNVMTSTFARATPSTSVGSAISDASANKAISASSITISPSHVSGQGANLSVSSSVTSLLQSLGKTSQVTGASGQYTANASSSGLSFTGPVKTSAPFTNTSTVPKPASFAVESSKQSNVPVSLAAATTSNSLVSCNSTLAATTTSTASASTTEKPVSDKKTDFTTNAPPASPTGNNAGSRSSIDSAIVNTSSLGTGTPQTTTDIFTSFTTYCPSPTTLTTHGQTFTVTEPTTLVVTAPCTEINSIAHTLSSANNASVTQGIVPSATDSPQTTTEVFTSITAYCPNPTTLTTHGQTFTVTEPTTLIVTAPCTETNSPISMPSPANGPPMTESSAKASTAASASSSPSESSRSGAVTLGTTRSASEVALSSATTPAGSIGLLSEGSQSTAAAATGSMSERYTGTTLAAITTSQVSSNEASSTHGPGSSTLSSISATANGTSTPSGASMTEQTNKGVASGSLTATTGMASSMSIPVSIWQSSGNSPVLSNGTTGASSVPYSNGGSSFKPTTKRLAAICGLSILLL